MTDDGRTVFLVFDHADVLRGTPFGGTLLAALLRLSELARRAICTIFISQVVWDHFAAGTGFTEPLAVHFPVYSRADMLQVLLHCEGMGEGAPEEEATLRSNFASLLVGVFQDSCRDLNELRYLFRLLYPKYREPVCSGTCQASDAVRMFRHIDQYFKRALQHLFLRDISSAEWDQLCAADSAPDAVPVSLRKRTLRLRSAWCRVPR